MPGPWQLPPLILHPFAGGDSTEELLEGSRSAMALEKVRRERAGLGSGPRRNESELEQKVLRGRYQEIRMLLFLGKDLCRWVDQSLEFLSGQSDFDPRITAQTLALLAVEAPPPRVREKLERWGVADRKTVFARAIGIHGLFEMPPALESLSPVFLTNYHRYADHAWMCFQNLRPFHAVDASQFQFELFASEEYAQKLSAQWEKA